MLAQMMDVPLTITHLLDRAGTLFPSRPVVSRRPDRTVEHSTWGEVAHRARRLAAALTSLGIQPGDRVATLAWNHRRHLEAYFGIPMAGAVLHTLNLRLHPTELEYIVAHAGDRVILVEESLLPLLDRVHPSLRDVRLVVMRDTDAALPADALDYDALLDRAPDWWQGPEIDERQAAALCYTTGTTGAPKGVLYSHRSTVLHALGTSLPDFTGLSEHDVALPVVPMFHVNAWGLPFSAAMLGMGLVLPGRFLDAESLLELFEQEGVTLASGVPTVWLAVLLALDKEPARWNVPRLKRLFVGGAAAPPSMMRGFEERHGITVVHAWGMTETSPVAVLSRLAPDMHTLDRDEQWRVRSLQGRPLPLVEIRARTSEGIASWGDERMGELEVRGPWIASSYFNNADGASAFTDDGWLRTGDIVTIDRRGFVHIQDRAKDLVKSGGEWISSIALENAIMGHPAVREAAVIAIPDERWGERPLAVVVFAEGHAASAAELRAFLTPQVASWWLPERFAAVDAIPRTAAGKFRKVELRQAWAEGKIAIMDA